MMICIYVLRSDFGELSVGASVLLVKYFEILPNVLIKFKKGAKILPKK